MLTINSLKSNTNPHHTAPWRKDLFVSREGTRLWTQLFTKRTVDRQKSHFNFYFVFKNVFTESVSKRTYAGVCAGEAPQLQTPACADRGLSNKAAEQKHRSPTFFLEKSELQKQV